MCVCFFSFKKMESVKADTLYILYSGFEGWMHQSWVDDALMTDR